MDAELLPSRIRVAKTLGGMWSVTQGTRLLRMFGRWDEALDYACLERDVQARWRVLENRRRAASHVR